LLQSKEYQHFRIAVAFSFGLMVLMAAFLFLYGKHGSFLVINGYKHPLLDYMFMYGTYLGHGMIWVPLFLYTVLFKREYFIAILSGLIICTFITHFAKLVIFPEELRPVRILVDKIRIVKGVQLHQVESLPSGHTSTAFTLALLLAFRIAKMAWSIFFPLVAFFVAYSRVYLGQHFVTDVFAGTLVGIASAFLALMIYKKWKERKTPAADLQR
jgi:membrane-associated phospholipid phosphatase